MCALSFAFAYTDGRHITRSITRPAGAQAPHLTVPRPGRKRHQQTGLARKAR
ncbi:hypothetical protein HMPREF3231_00461 [Bifidobacterium longum]|nr:hypothetical protein HMPREF3231_00461 [Bifidobacterium longum]